MSAALMSLATACIKGSESVASPSTSTETLRAAAEATLAEPCGTLDFVRFFADGREHTHTRYVLPDRLRSTGPGVETILIGETTYISNGLGGFNVVSTPGGVLSTGSLATIQMLESVTVTHASDGTFAFDTSDATGDAVVADGLVASVDFTSVVGEHPLRRRVRIDTSAHCADISAPETPA